MNNATIIDTMVNDALWDAFNNYHMMITAENVCEQWGLTREAVRRVRSNFTAEMRSSSESWKQFKDEIVPVPVKKKKETVM